MTVPSIQVDVQNLVYIEIKMHCFVVGCKNSTRVKGKVSFHSFPKNADVQKRWLHVIGRDPKMRIIYHRVCSDHFVESDIDKSGNKLLQVPNAAPSRNLPDVPPLNCRSKKNENCYPPNIINEILVPYIGGRENNIVDEPSISGLLTDHIYSKTAVRVNSPSSEIKKCPPTASPSEKNIIVDHNYSISSKPVQIVDQIDLLKEKNIFLQTKLKTLRRTIVRKDKKIASLKQIINELKKEKRHFC